MSRTVHVLTYEHKHGTDVSVYAIEGKALRSAVDIVLNWISDVTDMTTQRQILQEIVSGDYWEALDAWSTWQNEVSLEPESLVIEETPVQTESPSVRVLRERACKVQKELEEGTSVEPD